MKQEWKAVGSFGTVGLEMVLCVLVGLFIGQWLDAKLGTEPVLTVLWFCFGVGAASKAVWRTWKEMQLATAREEREQGNPAPIFDDAARPRDERDDRWTAASRSTGGDAGAKHSAEERDDR